MLRRYILVVLYLVAINGFADAQLVMANDKIDDILEQIDEESAAPQIADDASEVAPEQKEPSASKAEIIILNKITAKSKKYIIELGKIEKIGNISLMIKSCFKGSDPFQRDHAMAIFIWEDKDGQDSSLIFHSWILAKNLSIVNFEHPVYEILPQRCW
jgi:hypothetical protein